MKADELREDTPIKVVSAITDLAALVRGHDLPGVQADTHLDETSLGLPNSLRVALDRFLHSERCITGPYRMVLMSDGRAEQDGTHPPTDFVLDHLETFNDGYWSAS